MQKQAEEDLMRISKQSLFWILTLVFFASGNMSCREHGRRLHKTSEVQKVLNSRKSRVHELQALKAKGLIGENDKGFIEILKPLQPKEKSLIEAENHDRKFIYNTAVAQNHLGSKGLEKVEEDFAKTHRARARKGDLIQNPDGQWVQK